LIAAAAVGLVWHRRLSLPVRAAILAAATPVAIPVAVIYDLLLSAIGMAWLVRVGQHEGFRPWQRVVLALLFVWPIVGLNMDERTYSMAPPLVAAGVFAMAWLCARQERTGQVVASQVVTAPSGVA